MLDRSVVFDIIDSYDLDKIKIGCIASHYSSVSSTIHSQPILGYRRPTRLTCLP